MANHDTEYDDLHQKPLTPEHRSDLVADAKHTLLQPANTLKQRALHGEAQITLAWDASVSELEHRVDKLKAENEWLFDMARSTTASLAETARERDEIRETLRDGETTRARVLNEVEAALKKHMKEWTSSDAEYHKGADRAFGEALIVVRRMKTVE